MVSLNVKRDGTLRARSRSKFASQIVFAALALSAVCLVGFSRATAGRKVTSLPAHECFAQSQFLPDHDCVTSPEHPKVQQDCNEMDKEIRIACALKHDIRELCKALTDSHDSTCKQRARKGFKYKEGSLELIQTSAGFDANPTDGSQFVELYSSGKCCNSANNGYADSWPTTMTLEECKQRCEDLSCTYFTYHSGLYASEPSEQGACKTVTGECKEYDHPRCGDNICQVYQRATPAPTPAPTTPPITPAPTPAPTVPLNSQTAGCWAPAHGTSEDYNVYVDATSTHSAVSHANANGIQDGDPWIAAVTAPCAACVKSSLLIGGNQTRFDCTVCPSGSTLVVTNIVRQSGWCNANQESCAHTSGSEQCETCVKTVHAVATQNTKQGSCTTCSTGAVHSAYSWQENGKLADGTLMHPVTLGTGYCYADSTDKEMGYKVTTGTGMYDYGAPWCFPSSDWDAPKLICTKLNTVQMRMAVGTVNSDELYLVECEIRKLMHRYKCYNDTAKCRTGEPGPLCDDTGTSCGEGMYRGESTKTVSCVGFYTEVLYGHRGTSLGCDNIPESAVVHLGCTAGDSMCAQVAACSRTAAIE